jgi:VWFA-related protein
MPAVLVVLTVAAGPARPAALLQNPPADPALDPAAAATPGAARTVHIDAVVTDRKGAPILNLRAADFDVVENGVVQRIEAVELRGTPGPSSPALTPFPIASAADELRAARESGTRVIALLLDEFHVSAGEHTDRVRTAMLQFMDEQVRASDLLLVLKPLESVTTLRFTRDHQAVRAAIESFQGRKDDYEARTPFEKQYLGSAPEAVRAGRAQIVMSGLREIILKLGDLQPGRSAVVLASEGFARDGLPRDRERRVPDVQGLIRGASRFNVAVYVLDPSAAPAPGAGPAGVESADRGKAVLRNIAVATGGEAVAGGQELRPALVRLAQDLDAYYVLTYTSSHPSDGRFYDVVVRAKRPDAHVKTRSGYWAPLRTELMRASAGSAMAAVPLRALRRSPLIDTWVGFTIDPRGTQHVVVTWEPTVAVKRPVLGQPHTVELRVSTPSGGTLFEGALVQARGTAGVDYTTSAVFEASPGRLQFDLVILRLDGTRLDTAAHDVDLPDGSKVDPRILPPQVFRSNSAREFRALVGNDAAAPVPSREFRRTERLLLRVPTYSPSGAAVKLSAKLVNRVGQSLRELQTIDPTSDGILQYDVPLASLAPGEYRIELTATTETATAREAIRFRVTG